MNSVFSSIKKRLFTNWHTMRWVALALSAFFAAMGFWYEDVLTGFLSAFFLFQAVTNTGCMVAQSCGVPVRSNKSVPNQNDVEFSEIKEQ